MCASTLVFVWRHRFLPLQDYPEWLVQGKLFADLLNGELHPAYTFVERLVPNASSTLIIGVLARHMDYELAGKWLLSGQLLLHAGAALYLLGALAPVRGLTLMAAALSLLFNYSFFHGNINYTLALACLFAGQGLVLRHYQRIDRPLLACLMALSLLIYLCHGAAYAAWLMFLAAIGIASRSPAIALRLVAAVVPSLLAAASYVISRSSVPNGVGVQWYASPLAMLGEKLWTLIKFACPLQGFYPFLPTSLAWLFVAGNLVVLFACCAALSRFWPLARKSEDPRIRALLWTVGAYALVFVTTSRELGGLVNPGERMLLPAFQLLLTAMVPLMPEPRRMRPRVASSIAVLLLGLQAAYVHGYVASVSSQLESSFHRLVPYTREPTRILHESHFGFRGHPSPQRPLSWRLLPLHYPTLHLMYYAERSRGEVLPLLATGLFQSALDPVPNDTRALTQLGPDTLLVFGRPSGCEAIIDLLEVPVTRLASDNLSHVVLKLAPDLKAEHTP